MCSFNHKVYNSLMLPLERVRLGKERQHLFQDISGDILEIGFGTGVNLRHYPYGQISSLTLTDKFMPSHVDLKGIPSDIGLEMIKCDATALPFKDESFDNVVFTLVFCTVTDPYKGLKEIERVLKPGGKIYFIEHVEPSREPYKSVFNKLTPLWKKMAHGCCLNRDTILAIQKSGFNLVEYHRFYRTAFVIGIGEKIC